MSKPMSGKVAIVTGGTSGIGGAISRRLAELDARVIMVARDATKGAAAVASIKEKTGNQAVEFVPADLSLQKDVRALAASLTARFPRIDVLVNNAGGAFWKRTVTAEGVEMSLALNLLAPMTLTQLLLPSLKAAAPSRVINVVTKVRPTDVVDLSDLQAQKKYDPLAAYGKAKTALIAWSRHLAGSLDGTGVSVISMNPGVVPGTDFGTGMPRAMKAMGPVFARLFAPMMGLTVQSLQQAADTAAWLASSPEAASLNGQNIFQRRPEPSIPQTTDAAFATQLAETCAGLVRA